MSAKESAAAMRRKVISMLAPIDIGDGASLVGEEVLARAAMIQRFVAGLPGVNPNDLCGMAQLIDHACFQCDFIYDSYEGQDGDGNAEAIGITYTREQFAIPARDESVEANLVWYAETTCKLATWLVAQEWSGVEISSALEAWMAAMSNLSLSFHQSEELVREGQPDNETVLDQLLERLFGMGGERA